MRRVPLLFFVIAFVSVRRPAWPQGNPLGPEFRVNTYTTNAQFRPQLAADSSGNFVVVWMSNTQDGSNYGVFGQRYASSGTPLGSEFLVNTYTTGYQFQPAVASDASGNFVVVWTGATQDGSGYGVFGQRYASSGALLGPEFRVNTYTTSGQFRPAVASDSAGNFVVVWRSNTQDGDSFGVFGQRYASSGTPLGPEFRVNTYTTSNQRNPSVASDAGGNFVVAWESGGQDGSNSGVFGQRYASSGTPLGPEFRVNTYTTGYQWLASVASDSSGNFVVAWTNGGIPSYPPPGEIFAQRYASSGTPLGPEFRVNTYTTGYQWSASVAADGVGNFVVVWTSDTQDGSGYGAFGQRYASSGTPLGPEFRVNTYTTDSQYRPSVASDSFGNFVVAWMSNLQDGSGYGVFGQRYGPIAPVEISIADVTLAEGDVGTTTASFPVTLSALSGSVVSVDFATADGSATTADNDYLQGSGTLSFSPGQTSVSLAVSVVGDTAFEPDETFLVNLSNPVGATILGGIGIGTILNDDKPLAISTRDELIHESRETRGLDSISRFWRISQKAHSSYEVIVDAATGDIGPNGPDLLRLDTDGTTVLQTGASTSGGSSKSLHFENSGGADNNGQFIRVRSAGCVADCDPNDTFRIRAYDTTYRMSRFNNSATQVTVVVITNPTAQPVNGTIWFYQAGSGNNLASQAMTIAPQGTFVLNTSTIPALGGQAGSATFTNDAAFGALTGKAVAVEPATGFTFDTAMVPRPTAESAATP